MRRVPVFFVMLLAFTAMATPRTASAQTVSPRTVRPFNPPGPLAIFGPAVNPAVNSDIVIARLMTFDRDNDGRLVKSELPERMQNLLAADASGDQALDRDEIRAMARPAPPAPVAATVPGFRNGGGGGYTFGDQVSLSTRPHGRAHWTTCGSLPFSTNRRLRSSGRSWTRSKPMRKRCC